MANYPYTIYGDFRMINQDYITYLDKSYEEEIPVYKTCNLTRKFLGSINVCEHLTKLGKKVLLFIPKFVEAYIGDLVDSNNNVKIIKISAEGEIEEHIYVTPNGSIIFHVVSGEGFSINDEEKIVKGIKDKATSNMSVIVDQNLGLCTPSIIKAFRDTSREITIRAHPANYKYYYGVTNVIMNLKDLERIVGKQIKTQTSLFTYITWLRRLLDISNLIITRGKDDTILCNENGIYVIETLKQDVSYRVGVGDIFLSVFAAYNNFDIIDRIKIANIVSSLSLTKTDHIISNELIEREIKKIGDLNVKEYKF